MPTDNTDNQLVRIAVEGYDEHGRISTKFFDSNGTEFELPNSAVHNLDAYLDQQVEYITVARHRAEVLKQTKQIEYEEHDER